jgi:orotidine-5'-phosphate decarboxylase
MIDAALENGGGVFVIALTSNPEGAAVQHATSTDGRTVAQVILDEIAQVNAGAVPIGSIGAVIGATVGETGHDLTNINGFILAPGLGAQGATAADLHTVFGEDLSRVLPSYSREILSAGPSVTALRDATERALSACREVISTDG